MTMDRSDLQPFFAPRSVVVYGAVHDIEKPAGRVFSLLRRCGRPVYAVHPTLQAAGDFPVYRSASELPEAPHLAVLAVSAGHCEAALMDALAAGAKGVIAVASGFGETGASGLRAEHRLVTLCRRKGARLLGPNTLGVFVPSMRLDTLFVEHGDRSLLVGGPIAVVSQSGSVGVEALGHASCSGFGLRAFVGLGNKADISELDMAEWFARDAGTGVLGFYLEDLVDARAFLRTLEKVCQAKPVVLLKGGRTAEGARAAASHTGSLAGSGGVAKGAWRQYGIHQVRDDQEFCDVCKALSLCPPMAGDRVAVVTPAGGYGVMAADIIGSLSGPAALRMAELEPDTAERLRNVLLPFASPDNPVDLTAACTDETYERVLDILVEAPEVDALLVVAFFAPEGVSSRLVSILASRTRLSKKPIVVFSLHGPFTEQHLLDFHDRGVAAFGSMSRSVAALAALRDRAVFLAGRAADGANRCEAAALDPATEERVVDILAPARGRGALHEADAKALLHELGIDVPANVTVFPEAEEGEDAFARRIVKRVSAANLSFPVVLKVLSDTIDHKSDLGGVRTGIRDQTSLFEAVRSMRRSLYGRGVGNHGVLVEEHVEGRVEAIVGGLTDPEFGPSVMVGLGGIWSEAFRDVAFRLAPVRARDVQEMLDELVSARIFRSFRGFDFPTEAFCSLVVRFSQLFYRFSDRIDQIDLNPVAAGPRGLTVLDAKVFLRKAGDGRPAAGATQSIG
jgi:acyl-CoA synthetase (NDP forming)